MEEKYNKLITLIKKYNSAIIAFSGGVDSTLLAYLTKLVLGDNMLLITATSPAFPYNELKDTKK